MIGLSVPSGVSSVMLSAILWQGVVVGPVLAPATVVETLVKWPRSKTWAGRKLGQVENLSSQRVKANFSWSKWLTRWVWPHIP